jgi:poly(beta-D-mannuronate) lyase
MKKNILLLLSILSLSGAGTLSAETITVSSLSALQSAINNASAGDIIILTNGVYTATSDIAINKQGTSAQPITITAQTIGGAEITGTGGFSIVSPAAYVVIKGFKFTHSASRAKMANGTSFCRWTHNIFQTPGDGEYLTLNGNDHEIDYNTFQNKNAMGRFIAVRGSGSQIAQRLWIHHNYFFNFPFQGGANGAEPFQFGLSGLSLSSSNSVIEHNLFEQCHGENEMLSVKASAVTVRYNTIRDCPAQFTLRHGNFCKVYGNYFINTPGLRIFGDDHVIYSNHFENCSLAINVGNGGAEVADGAPLTSHDRPDRVLIASNTLVNNTRNILQTPRTNGLGATFITVVNNIIQGGGPAAEISGPYTNPVWQGNIIFNTNGDGDMPASGYTTANPQLARDATGTFHLQAGSPAIGAATGSYPAVSTDMDGQSRTSPFDVGADETSTAPVTARILSPADVGHNANPVQSCLPAMASSDDGNIPANVLDGNLETRWSANGNGQWIQFCLNAQKTVSGVRVAFYNGNVRSSTFDVLVSTDGVNWTTAASGLVSSGTSLALETFTFAPRPAKHVRLVGHGNSVNLWNSYTEVAITFSSARSPYQGMLRSIPGKIEAEHYDEGEQGVVYNDLTTGNSGNIFRTDNVDLQATTDTGGGYNIGWVQAGEWMEYSVNVATAGTYTLQARVSATATGRTLHVELDGQNISGTIAVPNTGNYQTFQTVSVTTPALTAGNKIMRVVMGTASFNLNYVEFVQSAASRLATSLEVEATSKENAFALACYPNPHAETATISFTLKEDGNTTLAVYDLKGTKINALINERLPAGKHSATLDSRGLSAGTYIIRLAHNKKSASQMLVKK